MSESKSDAGQTAALSGKSVLIVGGSSGIGRAIAGAARSSGAHVHIAGRDKARLEETAAELGVNAAGTLDATNESSVRKFATKIDDIDHLVLTVSTSAAGLGVTVDMAQMDLAAAQTFFQGKFWAQYQIAQAVLPRLASDGSITFTSGVAVRRSLPGHTVVAANNAAIEAAARQLAKEIAPVRVNTISPGLTATRAYDHMKPQKRAEFFSHVTANQPVSRPGTPEEIAQAYLFAMTASYLTGTIIDIDGGFLVQ